MDIKHVGQHIKLARERRGLSQIELARRLGLRQSNLSRLERGLQGVSLETLALYARVLGVGIDELTAEVDRDRSGSVNGNGDPRLRIHADDKASPGLKALASDPDLCQTLAITGDEWRQLAAIPLVHTVTKAGYLQLLITLRAVQAPTEPVPVTES